ncbi:MAG: GIY-YIG nuclease family protein [Flavobacteriaceae bacterium]|nr:GIY-YIG nuclease family protein [Flavobacteriaceae bacterium]
MTLAGGLTSSKAKFEIMHYVYAIWSESHDKIYVGFSENPDKRLEYHNTGRSKYTKSFKPWKRFYLEQVESKTEALKKEKYLKSGWGRKKLKLELEKWQSGRMRQS